MVGKSLRIIILILNKGNMNKTLLNLFEQNEQKFREELSLILLPKDSKKLQDFMKDFFINKVSVEEYKKELSVNEIAMLNSVMKLVALQTLDINIISDLNEKTYNSRKISSKESFYGLDMKALGSTAIGGLVGSFLFKTWGGVLLSIAGCAFGMYISSTSHPKQEREVNRKLDVSKYIQTLKGICKSIDEVVLNYHTSVNNIIKEYENVPKATLATAYKPLLNRLASLYIAVNTTGFSTNAKSEFDKLFRTLKNHHYEILGYSDETKEYFIDTISSNVNERTIVKAAILENGKLLEQGECLIPKN